MQQPLRYTYDGVPITPDPPYGAAIIVRRPAPDGDHEAEYLVLHRAQHGPDYAGDWAWTPPSGSRQPGEAVLGAALRELAEEASIVAAETDLRALDLCGAWVRFGLDVPAGTTARVDPEHDRLDWLPLDEAIARCRPATVADGLRLAAAATTAQRDVPAAGHGRPARAGALAARSARGPLVPGAPRPRGGGAQVRPADQPATRRSACTCSWLTGRTAATSSTTAIGDVDPAAADPDAIGLDFAIGVEELTGRGLGPQLIWSYVRDVALPAHPAARLRGGQPGSGQHPLHPRASAKSGFDSTRRRRAGAEARCVLDVVKFFGEGDVEAMNVGLVRPGIPSHIHEQPQPRMPVCRCRTASACASIRQACAPEERRRPR